LCSFIGFECGSTSLPRSSELVGVRLKSPADRLKTSSPEDIYLSMFCGATPLHMRAYRCLRASGPVKPTPVNRCGWLGPPQPGVRGATPQTPRAAPHRTEMRGSRGHPSNPRTQGHPGSSPEAKPLSLPPHSYLRGRSLLQLEWREKRRGGLVGPRQLV
jgi:hypothetical protein